MESMNSSSGTQEDTAYVSPRAAAVESKRPADVARETSAQYAVSKQPK